jgi:dihydroneopterin aldolase
MLTVGLKDVTFRAYHGVYASEQIVGSDFVLNLSVKYDPGKNVIHHLEETLNYEELFHLAKDIMERPVALLEQVVTEMAGKIFITYPFAAQVSINLEKCNPPIEQLNGSVFVNYDISRNTFLQKG